MIKLILDLFTSFVVVIKLKDGHAECTDETISEYPLLAETLNGDKYLRHLYNGKKYENVHQESILLRCNCTESPSVGIAARIKSV